LCLRSESAYLGGKAIASLTINSVSKKFGAATILDAVSFQVADGEFTVLLGPSGCGKSTLLRLVAGLESLSGGEIFIGDERVDHLPPRDRDIAFVFQNYALYPHMTVHENLAFSLRLRHVPKDEIERRVAEAAMLLELKHQLGHKPQQLSGGQRQRVAVGRAIVRQPKIFLFDEPLSNLDAALRANMRVELARLHERLGATILYVTHDQAEAMTLGEKIIVLEGGKIQQAGTASEIYHRPLNVFVARFVGSPQMNLIDGMIDTDGSSFRSGKLSIALEGVLSGHGLDYAGKPVTLGIRPEDLLPANPDHVSIQGEVDLVEDLGSDNFVHLESAGARFVVRTPANASAHKGQRLHFDADPKRLHLFYQGQRIN
jgi:multiple sugar transport system ATP-binding protein